MAVPIFRASSPSFSSLSQAPVFLSPVRCDDGRHYDLCNPCIQHGEPYTPDTECVRWVIHIEAQNRHNGDNIDFVADVFWSLVLRNGLAEYDCRQERALLLIMRERVADWLQFHPNPARCCSAFHPIYFEIG